MSNLKGIDFKSKRIQLIVLGVLVLLSVYLRLSIPQSLVEDQDDFVYHSFAEAMVAGESFPGGYYWPSGMTLFLYGLYSLFGVNIKIILIGISILSSILLYFIAWELFKNKTISVVAFILSLFDMDMSHYSVQLFSEGVYTFLILLIVYCSIRLVKKPSIKYSLVIGVCVGLAMYQKVFTVGLVVIVPLYLLVNSLRKQEGKFHVDPRVLKYSAVILLVTLLTITPRLVWIYQNYGVFVFMTATSGTNLFIGNNPYATGCYSNEGFKNHEELARQVSAIEENELKAYYSEKIAGGIAREYILENPARFARKIVRQFTRHWLVPNRNCWRRFYEPPFYVEYTRLLWFFSLMGLIYSLRGWREHVIVYLFGLMIILITLIVFAGDRYAFPLTPFRLMFAAYTLYWLSCKIKSRESKQLMSFLVVFSIFMVLVMLPAVESTGFFDYHDWRGYIHLQEDQYDEAIKELSRAVSLNPSSMKTQINLAVAYRHEGLIDEEIRVYKMVLGIDPHFVLVHNNLAMAYSKKGMLDETIAEYQKAEELDPNDVRVHNNLAAAYSAKRMLDEAIVEYKKALELSSHTSFIYNNLGTAYFKKGMYDEAMVNYKKALELDPSALNTRINLGAAYFEKGMYDIALNEFNKVIEVDPENEKARSFINKIREHLKEKEGAS